MLLRKDGPAARHLAEQLEAEFGPLSLEDKRKLLHAYAGMDAPIAASLSEFWRLPVA